MLGKVTDKVVERGGAGGDKIPRVQVPAFNSTLRAKVYLWTIYRLAGVSPVAW